MPSRAGRDIRSSWRVLMMGGLSILTVPISGLLNACLRIIFDPANFNSATVFYPGMIGMLLSIGLAIATIFNFSALYKAGERHWILWTGLVSAGLVTAFWAFMIAGEFIFPH